MPTPKPDGSSGRHPGEPPTTNSTSTSTDQKSVAQQYGAGTLAGSRVTHPDYGPGDVQETLPERRAVVAFEDTTVNVPVSALARAEEATTA